MTWQPIETAPKDGTAVILGYYAAVDGIDQLLNCVMVGEWEHENWNVSMGISAGPVTLLATMLIPWTHWMPLPKPPGETTSAIPEEVKAYLRNALMVGGWRGEI